METATLESVAGLIENGGCGKGPDALLREKRTRHALRRL